MMDPCPTGESSCLVLVSIVRLWWLWLFIAAFFMADHTKFSKPRPPFSRRVPIILTSYELPGILAVWFIFGLLYFYHDVVLPLMAEQPLNVFTWPFVIWFGVLFIGKTLWRYRQEIYGLTLTPEKLKRRTELLELKIREQKLRIELEKM